MARNNNDNKRKVSQPKRVGAIAESGRVPAHEPRARKKMREYESYLRSALARKRFGFGSERPITQKSAGQVYSIYLDAIRFSTPVFVPKAQSEQLMSSALHIEPTAREWTLSRDISPDNSGFCWFEIPIPIGTGHPASQLELTGLTWIWGSINTSEAMATGRKPQQSIMLSALIKTPERPDGEPHHTMEWLAGASYSQTVSRLELGWRPENHEFETEVTQILRVFAALFHHKQTTGSIPTVRI